MTGDSRDFSNTPPKLVKEPNGTSWSSSRKPETPSDQDRTESVPKDEEDDMAMIRPFHEEQPPPRDSGESTSPSEDRKESPKGSPKQADKDQSDSSAASNGGSKKPSAQDGTEHSGTSTGNAWSFVESTESLLTLDFPASVT